MTNESLERRIDIETPEQTVLSYTIAGVGSRSAAALVDYFNIVVAEMVLFLIFAEIAPIFGGRAPSLQKLSGGWVVAVLFLLSFALQWGYFVFFESIWDGQTPGKHWLGIRVVQDGGHSV
mgnify:CR=1 FL=1